METFQYLIKYNPLDLKAMLSPEAEVWRQRDTLLKNRGMRIQTVQEKQRQEKRPLRTEVGNDLRNR